MVRSSVASLLWVVCLQFSHAALGQPVPCGTQPVAVSSAEPPLQEIICAAATQALEYLQRYDLHPRQTVHIGVVEYPLISSGHPIYGRYDRRSDRIHVMSLQSILNANETPLLYDEPLDLELYRSVIAHEVAHAVVQHNSRTADLAATVQEYLAHATQLAVLPEARRARIIAAAGVGPWEPGDVISDIYMAMAITRFAVKCYLHLSAHQEPVGFVHTLLASKWRYVTVN